MYFKFLLCANFMTNLKFSNEFVAIAYELLYLNIMIAFANAFARRLIGIRVSLGDSAIGDGRT